MTKLNIILLTLSILLLTFSGCKKDELAHQNDFDKSYSAWLNFKKESNNSYKYVVSGGSWVGTRWETTLTVRNGKVVKRTFEMSYPEECGCFMMSPEEEEKWMEEHQDEMEWVEEETEIGSHKDTPAAAPVNLDEVYRKAKEDWLKKRKGSSTYFKAENDGILSSCGYVIDGCQDDCFVGITITEVEGLEG